MRRLGVTIATVVMSLVWLQSWTACGSSDEPKSRSATPGREEQADNMKQIFATYFADYGRTCYVPAALNLQGEIAWSSELAATEDTTPRAILFMAGIPLVESPRTVTAFSDSGRQLWQIKKADQGPAGVFGGTLYFQDEKFRLSGVNLRGEKVLESTYLPDAPDDRFLIRLFAPFQENFVSVIQFTGGPQDHPKKVLTEQTIYKNRMSEWVVSLDGSLQKLPLYADEVGVIVLPMDELVWVDANSGEEKARKAYPLAEVGCCCLGADGTLYVAGANEGREELVAMDRTGREIWRWRDEEGGGRIECRQPPVVDPEGRVFLLMGDHVAAVKDGKLLWRIEVEDAPALCATAFRGGQLLFATAGALFTVDAEGKVAMLLPLKEAPVAPPSATLDGDVYLLTAHHLMKLR